MRTVTTEAVYTEYSKHTQTTPTVISDRLTNGMRDCEELNLGRARTGGWGRFLPPTRTPHTAHTPLYPATQTRRTTAQHDGAWRLRRPSPLEAACRDAPRCRATNVHHHLDGESRATTCLVADLRLRRRCRGEDAQLIAARAVPPASVARLLAAWCGPAEWRSVQGESPAPRGVKSEQGSPALSRATICRNRAGRVSLECRPRYELM